MAIRALRLLQIDIVILSVGSERRENYYSPLYVFLRNDAIMFFFNLLTLFLFFSEKWDVKKEGRKTEENFIREEEVEMSPIFAD